MVKHSVEARETQVRFLAGAPSAYDVIGNRAGLRNQILQVRVLLGVPNPNIPTVEEAISNIVQYKFESCFGYHGRVMEWYT